MDDDGDPTVAHSTTEAGNFGLLRHLPPVHRRRAVETRPRPRPAGLLHHQARPIVRPTDDTGRLLLQYNARPCRRRSFSFSSSFSPPPSSRSRPRSPPDPCRNDQGLACDDDGEVIGCGKGNKKVLLPRRIFRGRTAKEVSVEILESQGVGVQCDYCSHLEHANYLGRELQKAEFCLRQGQDYVQD